jgi:hypothetical protein
VVGVAGWVVGGGGLGMVGLADWGWLGVGG